MDARNLEIRLLRYFVAVAEELHFGRAAARLAITQPPLSQAIQSLESMLGVELFIRTRRSVRLSVVGKDLLPEVQRLLGSADALRTLAQSLARGEAGSLSLAFVSTADYGILPDVLGEYTSRCPGVRLTLTEATSDLQAEEIAAGRVDAGFVIPPLPARHRAALSYMPVVREPLILAVPETVASRLGLAPVSARNVGVSLHDVADEPLVIFPRQLAPGFHDTIVDYYAALGLAPRMGQQAIQMQTIVSLVSAGMGIALVPESLRKLRRTGVVYCSLRGAGPQLETGLAWRTGDTSPVLCGFIDVVRPHAVCASRSRVKAPPTGRGIASL
ncbi:LysR family transcriptional regulator [Paraburkholderia caledonica]